MLTPESRHATKRHDDTDVFMGTTVATAPPVALAAGGGVTLIGIVAVVPSQNILEARLAAAIPAAATSHLLCHL